MAPKLGQVVRNELSGDLILTARALQATGGATGFTGVVPAIGFALTWLAGGTVGSPIGTPPALLAPLPSSNCPDLPVVLNVTSALRL